RNDLAGDLPSQLAKPVATARGAVRLLSGTHLLDVHTIQIAMDRVEAYLNATPEPARGLVKRFAEGASPRGLILSGEVAPRLVEAVLVHLAAHAAIVAVRGANGTDFLPNAIQAELVSLQRGATPSLVPPPLPPAATPPFPFAIAAASTALSQN